MEYPLPPQTIHLAYGGKRVRNKFVILNTVKHLFCDMPIEEDSSLRSE